MPAPILQARKVKGFEPEGLHLTPWQQTERGWSILVSWQTGEARRGKTKHPPKPHDPSTVPGVCVGAGGSRGMQHFLHCGDKGGGQHA